MPLFLILIGAGIVWFALKNTGNVVFKAGTRVSVLVQAPAAYTAQMVGVEWETRFLDGQIVSSVVDRGAAPLGRSWSFALVMQRDMRPADFYQGLLGSFLHLDDVASGVAVN